MRRRELIVFVLAGAASAPHPCRALATRIATVGVLVVGRPDPSATLQAFRQELRTLGYVEGRNIRIEVLSANGNLDELPALAAGLARDKVDVIAAWMTPAVLAAKRATSEIPIVMIGAGDPVGMGIVASLARPGGNITGLAGQTTELAAKEVELLKEALPSLRRIAALCNAADPFAKPFLAQIAHAGKAQGIAITPIEVTNGAALDAAFTAMAARKVGAVIVQPSLPLAHAAKLALHYRIPAAGPLAPFAAVGGLMAYADDLTEGPQRAAVFVDRILKGAKPGDLPVEQPMRFKLVINLKTAKAIGIALPPAFLLRADEIIE